VADLLGLHERTFLVVAEGLADSKDHAESPIHQFMLRLLQLPEDVIAYFQRPCVL